MSFANNCYTFLTFYLTLPVLFWATLRGISFNYKRFCMIQFISFLSLCYLHPKECYHIMKMVWFLIKSKLRRKQRLYRNISHHSFGMPVCSFLFLLYILFVERIKRILKMYHFVHDNAKKIIKSKAQISIVL